MPHHRSETMDSTSFGADSPAIDRVRGLMLHVNDFDGLMRVRGMGTREKREMVIEVDVQ